MLCWRNIAIVLILTYALFYLLAPLLLGMYLAKAQLSFLGALCLPMIFINVQLCINGSSPINKKFNKLTDKRQELRRLIPVAKDAVWWLKRARKENLSFFQLDELRTRLDYIGIDSADVSALIHERGTRI